MQKILSLVVLAVLFAAAYYFGKNQTSKEDKKEKDVVEINDDKNSDDKGQKDNSDDQGLEIPNSSLKGQIVKHTGFTLSYNEEHEQANWVAYELKVSELKEVVERQDNFRPDEEIKTGSATPADYKNSGYDRGHIAPAADMKWSKKAMEDCFLMSNMSPQEKEFNRGIWKSLEEKTRDWARESKSIYIVAGGILTKDLEKIGKKNKVSIPKYYFKVILDNTKPGIKGIAFIMPNEAPKKGKKARPIEEYAVTIDEVEKRTGIDFFPKLNDKEEAEIESKIDISLWFN